MSPDPNDAYFSDGLTAEIITQLSYLRSLRVISRSSAMALKDTKKMVRTIGRELNVQYVMEGSVRKAGDNLRITAQLIDARTDEHLWAETYARKLEDAFEIQSEIALSVADALRASLDPRGVQRIKSRPTERLDAHDAYLLARHHRWSLTEEGMPKAKIYFDQAIELDPEYALARVGLAEWYVWGAANFGLLPAAEAIPRAKAEVQRAITLDPGLGDAHGILALLECWYDWDWERAEEEARIGVEQEPNSYFAWLACANLLGPLGRHEECLAAVDRLLELDPLDFVSVVQAAFHHTNAGRLDKALDYARRCEETGAGFWGAWQIAYTLQSRGEDSEALTRLIRVEEHWEAMRASIGAAVLAYALGRAGRAAAIVTGSGLLFIASTDDNRLRALDIMTGQELWAERMEGRGNANPMTYLAPGGRQYVAVSATDAILSYALP